MGAFLRKRAQQALAAGEATSETAETMDWPQRGAVDAISIPIGRAGAPETLGSS